MPWAWPVLAQWTNTVTDPAPAIGVASVAVLLSTYNGARYLGTQLDSILNQRTSARVFIHIRDDGSADGTMALILQYRERYPGRIGVHSGANVGVVASFLWLIEHSETADYYALADQDDYWQPGKLQAAIDSIARFDPAEPILYASAFDYVDHNLEPIGRFRTRSDLSLGNLLVENNLPGCSMVFNHALREIAVGKSPAVIDRILMHDWWLALLAVSFGRLLYDPQAHILYRQHHRNVVGIPVGVFGRLRARLRTLAGAFARRSFVDQAAALLAVAAPNLQEHERLAVDAVVKLGGGFFDRLGGVFSRAFYRSTATDDVALRCAALLGLFRRHEAPIAAKRRPPR